MGTVGVVSLVVLAAAGLGLRAWLHPSVAALHPKLHRITFRRGTIWNALYGRRQLDLRRCLGGAAGGVVCCGKRKH